ncbi:maltase A1-like [Diprion similis]|uniref:maltase A1-like n=1 Tax=Diprion similis TaxID=362088 RepID=UPI001EF93365|nr:maltase A1-like [Diprion similis]
MASTEVVTEAETATPIIPTIPDGPIFVSGEISGNLDWWQEAAVYQIYPKSFQDSNGDGVGDLCGIISRLDHLSDTGVTVVWLNSIFESPQVDGGFDISNFTTVDSIFGTLDDFAELIQQAHNRAIRVVIDFVPNHSSNEHIWFQNSVARIEPYTDYYVWRDGITTDNGTQPPNNWLSVFGGSAWTWNEQRQQYYLHQFGTSQVDLNFRNPAVVSEITNVLRFWLDQGVDGFRVSSVAHIFENVNFPDEPLNESPGPNVLETDYDYLQHIYTTDLDETIDLVYQWRTVLDEFTTQSDGQTRVLITDSAASQDVVARYFGNQTHQGAHLPLNFGLIAELGQPSLASDYIQVLTRWFATLPENGTSNWVLGNHDQRRPASRFGVNRVDGLNMLHLLPGTAFTYMGEELALLDTEISFSDTQDPHAINAGPDRYSLFTRDPARTPYHWDNSTSGGFSTNESTWLPMNSNYVTRNLVAQIAAEQSNFHTFKSILKLKQSQTIKRGATHVWALNNNNILVFTRELEDEPVYAVAINLGLVTVSVDFSQFPDFPSEEIRVCLASANAIISTGTVVNITSVSLSANAAVVLCNSEVPETTTVSITTTTLAAMPSTTVESSTQTSTTSPTSSPTESEPPTTTPSSITTPSTPTTLSTTMNTFSTTIVPSTETSAIATTLITSTTAINTTVPSTTVESTTEVPTIPPTMTTDKPEAETEPDYSEDDTTEDSESGATKAYISSLLIVVSIWNILL